MIEQFPANIANYNDYLSDLKTQSAVERQLGIIGEAVNKYNKLQPDNNFQNTSKIIGFSDRLIHSYNSIDSYIVWAILKRYLIKLKEEAKNLIQ